MAVEMNLKVEWRSALEVFGEQCVMATGVEMMQKLFAGSLATSEEKQVIAIVI